MHKPEWTDTANARTDFHKDTDIYIIDGYVECDRFDDPFAEIIGVFKISEDGHSWMEEDLDKFQAELTEGEQGVIEDALVAYWEKWWQEETSPKVDEFEEDSWNNLSQDEWDYLEEETDLDFNE